MAIANYLLQGLIKEENHQNIFLDVLEKEHDKIFIYSAFVKKKSVEDIRPELEKNKGKVTALIGIRNGVTSFQAIKCLYDLGVKVYGVDTGSNIQIFHPKTLLAINYNKNKADAIIGSANVTSGGFLKNIENSAILELDLNDQNDKAFVDSFFAGFNALVSNYSLDNVILIDSEKIINKLLDEGRVVDELTDYTISTAGKSNKGNQSVKKMPLNIGTHKSTSNGQEDKKIKNAIVLGSSFSGKVTEVWKSRELNERDLTIPSGLKTNPTGSMYLKKGAYDIDHQHYFRYEVFSKLCWSTRKGKPEYYEFASAKFHFIIDGIDYGTYSLTMKFDSRTDTASFKQRQGNVQLSWGDSKFIIKNRNLINKILYLYKVDEKDDEFVIEIKEK